VTDTVVPEGLAQFAALEGTGQGIYTGERMIILIQRGSTRETWEAIAK
jgi:hypothetical protein